MIPWQFCAFCGILGLVGGSIMGYLLYGLMANRAYEEGFIQGRYNGIRDASRLTFGDYRSRWGRDEVS